MGNCQHKLKDRCHHLHQYRNLHQHISECRLKCKSGIALDHQGTCQYRLTKNRRGNLQKDWVALALVVAVAGLELLELDVAKGLEVLELELVAKDCTV